MFFICGGGELTLAAVASSSYYICLGGVAEPCSSEQWQSMRRWRRQIGVWCREAVDPVCSSIIIRRGKVELEGAGQPDVRFSLVVCLEVGWLRADWVKRLRVVGIGPKVKCGCRIQPAASFIS